MEPSRQTDRSPAQAAPDAPHKPLVLGLTGGIAAGKSVVAGMLRDLGAMVLDADRIAHDILRSSEVIAEIRNAWPEDVFDAEGLPDRTKIAHTVFDHPEKLKQLNGWIHPRVRKIIRAEIDEAFRTAEMPLIVIDAPLLLEGELGDWCDRILFVEASPEVRADRARRERNWKDGEIARREARQHSLERKRRAADTLIVNNGSLDALRAEVARCMKDFLHPQN